MALLDLENANNEAWPSLLNGTNSSLLSQLLAGQPFHPTIGVSLDAEGQAAKHGSMAFVWSPNGTGWPSVFTNGSALLAGPPRAKSYSVDSKSVWFIYNFIKFFNFCLKAGKNAQRGG